MILIKLKIDLRPKQRPRKSKAGNVYSPVDPSHTALQKMYKYYMYENKITMIPKGVDIILSAEIYITHNAGDIDNLLKGIQDLGNKILYSDDKQIIGYDRVRLYRSAQEGKLILKIDPQNYLLEN